MPINIKQIVLHTQAAENTKIHALNNYYFHNMSKSAIARVYSKTTPTINRWIKQFEKTGSVSQKSSSKLDRKFNEVHHASIIAYFQDKPLSFLDEAQTAFKAQWGTSISISYIWEVLNAYGFRWKVLKQRAIHVKDTDVMRFTHELNTLEWTRYNLCFLDEVSFDNRGMIRQESTSECHEYYGTEGTFDRALSTKCCQDFALKSGKVQQYPGFHSIWIMDSAAIYRSSEFIMYLRSIGVIPLFLPAYCPFFNLIEVFFGLVKQRLRRIYPEGEVTARDLSIVVATALSHYHDYDFTSIFKSCGYEQAGLFNPTRAYKQSVSAMGFK
ncbi:Serine kinase [Chytriomyces hyalinus]|nr:Serine kinase [Chytriomyces hyalinus]